MALTFYIFCKVSFLNLVFLSRYCRLIKKLGLRIQKVIGRTTGPKVPKRTGQSEGMASGKHEDLERDFEAHMNWMQSLLSDPASGAAPKNQDATCAPSPLTQTEETSTTQYRISCAGASDDDSDCEEYYVDDAAQIRGQTVPEWARAANLQAELQRQQNIDPDGIFTNFERTCDLTKMFEKKKRTFKVRGDSGWWAKDGLTPAEEESYKKAVGFA
jgi:hypothetical protein